jgi:hypothetical protein
MEYAGRAIQLAEELFGDQRESSFIEKLGKAKSNIPEHADGARIYQKFVRPAFVDLRKVGAHYAIRSLFEPYATDTHVYQYKVEREASRDLAQDDKRGHKLAAGRAKFTSEITQESVALGFAALDRGDFNPFGGVLKPTSDEAYETLIGKLGDAFSRGDTDEIGRLLQQNFEGDTYALTVLFRDEQQRILNRIVESEWGEAEAAFGNLYPHLMTMIQTSVKIGGTLRIPRAFNAAAEFVLNTRLRRALASEPMDLNGIRNLLADAEGTKVALDVPTLEYTLRMRLERIAERFRADPASVELLTGLETAVSVASSLPLKVNFWKIQNTCYDLLQNGYHDFQQKAQAGDENSRAWIEHFQALAAKLCLRVG